MIKPESLTNYDEIRNFSSLLGKCFIQRRDLYPKQLDDGSYVAVHEPLIDELLVAHMQGEITLGAYVLDQDSRGRYMVLDSDNSPEWRQLNALSNVLEQMGCPSYLERSRRGGHLWLFIHERTPGKDIRIFGLGLMGHFGIKGVEMFPKQDQLTTGPGSLIRLPCGFHRKTGRRYGFITRDHQPIAPTIREQIKILCNNKTVPEEIFLEFHTRGEQLFEIQQNRSIEPWVEPIVEGDKEGLKLSDRIKAAMPVQQYILTYVELSPSGMGHCPFHDDQVESFSVNDKENYWFCFAGCGGGSIIDFHMRWEECDFTTAVRDLAKELL